MGLNGSMFFFFLMKTHLIPEWFLYRKNPLITNLNVNSIPQLLNCEKSKHWRWWQESISSKNIPVVLCGYEKYFRLLQVTASLPLQGWLQGCQKLTPVLIYGHCISIPIQASHYFQCSHVYHLRRRSKHSISSILVL